MCVWLFEVIVLPWIAPVLQLLHTPARRDDITELASVLVFPAVYLALGWWLIGRHTPEAPPGAEPEPFSRHVRLYRRLAFVALVFLVTFQAVMVIALSLIRYVPAEREIGWGMFVAGVAVYGAYFGFSLGAFQHRRRAARVLREEVRGGGKGAPEVLGLPAED